MLSLYWQKSTSPEELWAGLTCLSSEFCIVEKPNDELALPKNSIELEFKKQSYNQRKYEIKRLANKSIIYYSDLSSAFRAIGTLLSQIDTNTEESSFKTYGIMLDCSRNAVMKPEYFKLWLNKLALMGYNMAMLYTEDTYELPNEPYFGYLRGAYTKEELISINEYASALGIEMIPCIQTLGHLTQILKWDCYNGVKDSDDVLLVGEDKTYQLIEKMVKFWSEVFPSRRIHIGMDEAHTLGRGKFMDKFGYKQAFDIFNEHLDLVIEICKKYGYKPMIWSDMYFRMGSANQDYYDENSNIPTEVIDAIPQAADFVYWDYYHEDKQTYIKMIDKHTAMDHKPIMGSGIWTWAVLWYSKYVTEKNVLPCIQACREKNIDEVFFTMWLDDGSISDINSAMAGLAWCGELAYANVPNQQNAKNRFESITHGDYQLTQSSDFILGAEPNKEIWGTDVLWDDPLLGIVWNRHLFKNKNIWNDALIKYQSIANDLENTNLSSPKGGDLTYACQLAKVLAAKIKIRQKLISAYESGNKPALLDLKIDIAEIKNLISTLDTTFTRNWKIRNKPFGLEAIQIRFAGLIRRYTELDERINEYVSGEICSIPELETKINFPAFTSSGYRRIASSSSVF